tara:strand:- start:4 stop:306 length:303 start_codon:yes stop_codon:yes gene_type:complete
MSKPELVEPGMKYFMNMALINSKKLKKNYYSFWINLVCFTIFTLGITIWLINKYRGKLSPLEKQEKLRKQKYYILSKIKQYEAIQRKDNIITNLPKWNNI